MVFLRPISIPTIGRHFSNFFALFILGYKLFGSSFLNLIFPNSGLPDPITLQILLITYFTLKGLPDPIFNISPLIFLFLISIFEF